MSNLFNFLFGYVKEKLISWLMTDIDTFKTSSGSDFMRLEEKVRTGDVLLIQGRSRVSNVISLLTKSIWTHSVLYIGQINQIQTPELKAILQANYAGSENDKLIIESLLDKLTDNQQQVIARRFGLRGFEKATLEDVGKEIDLTRERVRQIQVEALRTLRGLLERVGLTQEDLF